MARRCRRSRVGGRGDDRVEDESDLAKGSRDRNVHGGAATPDEAYPNCLDAAGSSARRHGRLHHGLMAVLLAAVAGPRDRDGSVTL